MTTQLIEVGLTNAALATLIALLVLFVSRWQRNAQIEALLWIIVLVKFLTPPIVPYSIEFHRNAEIDQSELPTSTIKPVSSENPSSITLATNAGHQDAQLTVTDATVGVESAYIPTTAPDTNPETKPLAGNPRISVQGMLQTMAWLWMGGAVVAFMSLIIRGVQFNSLIQKLREIPPDATLHDVFRRTCETMQFPSTPTLKVVDADISPLAWTWLRRTVVVLPQALIQKLSPEQRSMVIVHELAHLRRRDHYVRWLEALVQSLYWWFPVVPFVRRKLHAAQEQCCDAWVMCHFPERHVEYGETLVAAANWLSGTRRSSALAMEFGRNKTLRRRIQAILQPENTMPLTHRSRAAILSVGLMLLVVSIRWVEADDQKPTNTPRQEQQTANPIREPQAAEQNEETMATTELIVTDLADQLVADGEVVVRGYTYRDEFFEKKLPLQQGRAAIEWKSDRIAKATLVISASGHMKHIKTFIRDKDQPYFVPDAQYKFNLQPGIKIGGQIVNADGEPVAGARVYGYLPNTKPDEEGIDVFEETATTDANGMWHMSGAPEDLRGMTLSFVERTDDFPGEKSAVLPEHHAALKTMSDVRTMTVAPKVQATVVDPEGKPIEGAMILLAGRNLFEDYGAKLIPKTDTKGSFELSVPADSPQVFTVFSRDWALKTVRVSSAEESPLTIVMQKGERLVFRTLTEDGRPAAGIQFHPEAPREGPFTGETPVNYLHALDFLSNRNLLNNTTGESGEFLWENAPREKLGYQIISSAYLSQPGGDYGPEGSPHTIVFRPIIPLSITIVADETGGSIEEYRIYEGTHFKSNPAGLWQWHLKRPSKEMQPGQFATHLRTLDREIKYRIQADGFRPAVTPAYDAKQLPNTPVSVEMRLKKDTGYEGLVQTPTKKPAAGAKVYTKIPRREDYRGLLVINGALDESTATAITIADADGVFRLQPHNEPFVCFVSHESGYANLADLDLWEKPEIVLTPWSAVEGVLQTKGKPIEGVEISMKMDDYSSLLEDMPSVQRYFSQQTGPDGRYRFEHVVAGTWRETITYDKTPSKLGPTHTHYADLKIVAGQKLVKRFGAKGITLVGRFVPPKGIDIDWQRSLVTLTQWKDEAHRQWHTRQYLQNLPNGSFELFNVEPAEYELELKVYRNHDRYEEPVVSKVVIITPEDFEKRAAGGILDMGMIKVDADPN